MILWALTKQNLLEAATTFTMKGQGHFILGGLNRWLDCPDSQPALALLDEMNALGFS